MALYGFENEGKLFPAVDHRVNFTILLVAGSGTGGPAEFAAFLRHPDVLGDSERRYVLSAQDISLINPNTLTCPVFRTRRDAEITKSIYRRIPILVRKVPTEENPWSVVFMAMLHMANDSYLFRTQEQLDREGWRLSGNVFYRDSVTCLPLFEAKMIYHFDHRYGDFMRLKPGQKSHILPEVPAEDHINPNFCPLPRYWVPAAEIESRLSGRWERGWILGWRDVTDARSSIRTVIATILPRVGVGHTMPILSPEIRPELAAVLLGNLSAFVFDYVARQKVGGVHLTYGVLNQLPLPAPDKYHNRSPWDGRLSLDIWILSRILELTYTAWDLQPFAQDCGYDGPPFRWDEARRFLLRCELDAAFFHLYEIERDDVDYIMETFPIVKRKDVKKHGDYRTKLQILDVYDAMQQAIDTGEPYQTLLDPPPADPRVAHPPREQEPEDGAAVVAFPSVPPEPTPYRHEPDLAEVAEPAPPYGEPSPPAVTPADRILAWLRDHPGWHARGDILAGLGDLSAGEWNPAIRELVEFGEVAKKGEKRGTRYRLGGMAESAASGGEREPDPAEVPETTAVFAEADGAPADRILAWLREHPGWHARADILANLGHLSAGEWSSAIRELVDFREVEKKGQKRGTRYRIPAPPESGLATGVDWAIGWIDRLETARGQSTRHGLEETEPGNFAMGWVELPAVVDEFTRGLYDRDLVLPEYDDHKDRLQPAFEDPSLVPGLSGGDCLLLLAYHLRADHFVEGHLAGVLDRGDITAILRRLAEIRQAGGSIELGMDSPGRSES